MKPVKQYQSQEEIVSQQVYWLNKLSGNLPDPAPLIYTVKTAARPSKPEVYDFQLSAGLSERVFKLTRGSGLSTYLVLLSALYVLLYRYTRSNDVIVLSPAYRGEFDNHPPGNLVPLRSKIKDDLTFKEFLLQVRQTALEAYANQNLPFEEMVGMLKVPQTEGRVSNITASLEGIHEVVEVEEVADGLAIAFAAEREKIFGKARYDSAVYNREFIERAIVHFMNILSCALDNLGAVISGLTMLTAAEEQQLLVEFNRTARPYPLDRAVIELFQEQAAKTPDAIAAVCEDEAITYARLNARANQLAAHLRSLSVGPESLVALLGRRSLNYLIAILAVWKAGGAYLSLDPSYPSTRLLQILRQSKSSHVIAGEGLGGASLSAVDDLPLEERPLLVAIEKGLKPEAPDADAPTRLAPNDLSYVFYTSGSTGVPKGAMVEQAGMCNHILAKIEDLQLTANDILAQNASQCFDVSVWQFLAALLVGGSVCILDDEAARDPIKLLEEVALRGITVLEIVPSQLGAMLGVATADGVALRDLPGLRCLFVMGEVLPPEMARRWMKAYPHALLVNAWGVTECSDDVTHHHVMDLPAEDDNTVSLGRPLPNMSTYLVDSRLSPVPVGIAGEIFIGGICVGRGYLDDPEKTASIFLPDPLSGNQGARIYKTGDLARYMSDGNIDFIGRIDQQVKVRGYRIEPGEIESLLSQHPDVASAALMLREDTPGEKRLVAYIVSVAGKEIAPSGLRNFLKEKLPDYMLPSVIVIMKALPLTLNGKLKRSALPAPDWSDLEADHVYVAPRTPVEETLAKVWAEVLGMRSVGIQSNFFELGGDSILSIQVVAKAKQAGVMVTPNDLFQHQTIAELAQVARANRPSETGQEPVTGQVRLTPIQRWFFDLDLANPDKHNQFVWLESFQPLDGALLEQAIESLYRHHDGLRLRFVTGSDGWQQHLAEIGGDGFFSRIDLSHLSEAAQAEFIQREAAKLQGRLNLASGPIIQVAFFDRGIAKPSLLLLIIHHLAVDGVSWRILHEDLETAYAQLRVGRTIDLPPKTTSFKKWAEWLNEFAVSDELEQEAAYWLRDSQPQVLPLPVDHVGGDNTMVSVRAVPLSLDFEQTSALLHEVPKAFDCRINEVLLAALVQAFSKWTGERGLLVELEGHGRRPLIEDIDVSRTIGWFTAIYPVTLDRGEDQQPTRVLNRVKQQLRQLPNDGIGYGLLRYLGKNREVGESLKSLPQPQVSFNYLGQFEPARADYSTRRLAFKGFGLESSYAGRRHHLLEFNGMVKDGLLQFAFSFSENLHNRSTIEALARDYRDAILTIINCCQSGETGLLSPSDFPEADLTQDQLDRLITMLD